MSARPAGDPTPLVSVVVAAFDEAAHMGTCLRSLRGQTYRPFEVIVIDDGSRDGTAAVAARFPEVTLVRRPHGGAGSARNLGASRARGEILAFLDADMAFPPPFLERLVAPMLEEGAIGTFTKDIRVANGGRRWARAHMLGRNLPPDTHFPPGFPDRWENFRAVWRRDFERVGGFDDVGHGEDVTLGRKLGALAVAAPGATCWHFEPETLADVARSARWAGRGVRIRETERPLSRYGPHRSIPRAARMAWRHHMPSLFLYRLVWDAGVAYGWLTRGRSRPGAK